MDAIDIISTQPLIRQIYLYARGALRMIPLPLFHLFWHAVALTFFISLLPWIGWTLLRMPFVSAYLVLLPSFSLCFVPHPTHAPHRALFFAAPFVSYALLLGLIVLLHITAAPPPGLVPGFSDRVDLALSYFELDNALKMIGFMLIPACLSIALPYWIPPLFSRAFWIRLRLFLHTGLTRSLAYPARLARRALAARRSVHAAPLSRRQARSFFERSINAWTHGLGTLRARLGRALKAPSGLARKAREQAAKHAFADEMELSLNTRAELDRETPAAPAGPIQSPQRL